MSATILDILETAKKRGEGCLIGKFGTVECQVLSQKSWLPETLEVLERNAGVFPTDDIPLVDKWWSQTREAYQKADCLALGWYEPTRNLEKKILKEIGAEPRAIPLRGLEPYYLPSAEDSWLQAFKGQLVCVVTSFAETARAQIAKGTGAVWPDKPWLWDGIEFCFVQTGYPPVLAQGRAGWEGSPESWEQAIATVVQNVMESGARGVLIGCGGLGMIIGERLKRHGKLCVVMGGATQVLFGIKGGRWKRHPVISSFWNSEWVWPSVEETPGAAEEVEGACYWKAI